MKNNKTIVTASIGNISLLYFTPKGKYALCKALSHWCPCCPSGFLVGTSTIMGMLIKQELDSDQCVIF